MIEAVSIADPAPASVSAPDVEAWSYRRRASGRDFPRTTWGHRGYDENAVDAYLTELAGDLTAADDQVDDLRSEVDRLHRYIRRQWAAVAAAEAQRNRPIQPAAPTEGAPVATPAAQARAVLTQAQEIAERRLAQADERLAEAERVAATCLEQAEREAAARLAEADAEAGRRIGAAEAVIGGRLSWVDAMADQILGRAQEESTARRAQAVRDARRLLTLARTRYEDIVVRAHQRADRAAEVALSEFEDRAETAGDLGRARVELEIKAAYLRTFAKVSRAALQAALDVTAREFDRLLGDSASFELGLELTPSTS